MALAPDAIAAGMRAAADQITAMCKGHDAAEHGGEACLVTRAGAVAYLAHCLGLRGTDAEHMLAFALCLRDYEATCRGGHHGHHPERN